MPDRIGQQFGNYRILHVLGAGGCAEVYLGVHIHLGTQAAIKLLHTQLAVAAEVEAFRAEARTIANLMHPNIVRVLDFGVEHNTPYLVMDYAPNGSLRTRLPPGAALAPASISPYVKQAAEALQYAHDRKLIHRDVKPENILLGHHNEVLLSDFGIALVAQTSNYQSTQTVLGTAAYMAPEQLQGHPRPASDQYALGIVVYEWLAGARPFQGSFTEIAAQHVLAAPPPLREKLPTLSPAVEQVVLTALAKDPKNRFGSVREFATAFEHAGQGVSLPSSYSTRIQMPSPATTSHPVELPAPSWLSLANATTHISGPSVSASQVGAAPVPPNPANWPTSGPSITPRGYTRFVAPATPWAVALPSPQPASMETFSTGSPAPAIASKSPPPPVRKKGHPVLITLISLLLVVVLAGGTLAGLGLLRQGPLAFLGLAPVITVKSTYHVGLTPAGAVGTVFHITGQKFSSDSTVIFLLDGRPVPGIAGVQSDGSGAITTDLTVSDIWASGSHRLTAIDASGYATKSGAPLLIVHQCQAHIPCANGAPPDDASFTLTAIIQRSDAITGEQLGSRTITLIFTGHPYPHSGTACQSRDTGQKEIDTLTGSDGVPYQNSSSWTCQSSYQGGKLSYTEMITLNRADYANGHSCVSQTPFISEQLVGAFTNSTTMSGTYYSEGFTNICNPGNIRDTYDSVSGSWTGTITNSA